MKAIKSLTYILTATAALAFCAMSAKAVSPVTPGIGIVTNYTALNVSITVITNGAEATNGTTISIPSGKATINNSYLLKVFGHWAGTNWPSGAKLELGWDDIWNGDVLVVDKTSTNVLFDASSSSTNSYFAVFYRQHSGAQNLKLKNAEPGNYTYNDYDDGEIKLHDNNVYLPFTDLDLVGGSTVTYTQNWNAEDIGTTWNLKADLTAEDNANDESFLGINNCTASGTADTSGSGKYFILYFYL